MEMYIARVPHSWTMAPAHEIGTEQSIVLEADNANGVPLLIDKPGQSESRRRCIFILSLKSSGSSVLQRHLARICDARLMRITHHSENETLYWTKAASVLGLEQFPMENSEVPIPPRRALSMLKTMVRDNVPAFTGDLSDVGEIFAAWTAIIAAEPGTFIEKSPHHLYQPSVVRLMERYADQVDTVDVQFIGLVRNPTDTLYSSWRRFGVEPQREERHWLRAYDVLREFQARRPDLISIVRYEDLVAGATDIAKLLNVNSIGSEDRASETFHAASIQKWRKDRRFGYSPSQATCELAAWYGYKDGDVSNPNAGPWWLHRTPRAALWAALTPIRRRILDVRAISQARLRQRERTASRRGPFG